jgi:hypothetical protein
MSNKDSSGLQSSVMLRHVLQKYLQPGAGVHADVGTCPTYYRRTVETPTDLIDSPAIPTGAGKCG